LKNILEKLSCCVVFFNKIGKTKIGKVYEEITMKTIMNNPNWDNLGIIILAAGKGTRMKSDTAKVLHKLARKSMITHVLEKSLKITDKHIYVVVGHQADQVKEEVNKFYKVNFAYQKQLLGTGDAVKAAIPMLDPAIRNVLVLCGDVPLIKEQTLQTLVDTHINGLSDITILATTMENPKGYGRIICDKSRKLLCIREEADATIEEKKIQTINTGIYCFDKTLLTYALNELSPENTQGEYYLTDVIEIAGKQNKTISVVTTKDSEQLIGVNTIEDLHKVEHLYLNSLL
jgi:UDP-N-acetylglucosamine pyrophosphorylase